MKRKQIPPGHCDLNFSDTISRWDEAIPLGNGLCGALIWGEPFALRFSLDRGDIWDNSICPAVNVSEFNYSTMVRLAREKNETEIRRIFDLPYQALLPSKLPAGKLIFNLNRTGAVRSTLHLRSAEAILTIGDVTVRSFLHAQQQYGMIEVSMPRNAFSFDLQAPGFSHTPKPAETVLHADTVNAGALSLLHYNAPERYENDTLSWFVQEIDADFSYGIFVAVRSNPHKTQLAYSIANSNDGADWRALAIQRVETAVAQGYISTLSDHKKWWTSFWGKSSISVPEPLFEKSWYLTQYLLGSCSRKGCYPMPLQGVWTADHNALPPWKGDYHNDLNTQMSYYSYLKANHLEEGECFLDYLWNMAACGRAFAAKFYQAPGLCMPGVMSLRGAPLGGWGMYSLSPTNQIWLAQLFERHYRFTGDTEFLRQKAYPYLKETAEFIFSLLEEHDGFLFLPISTSPEIHDDTAQAFVTPNSNYDLALLRYLFTVLEELCLRVAPQDQIRWSTCLHKLPQLALDPHGRLKVSPDESLKESHRHFSHAMAIHPLRLLPYSSAQAKSIIDASVTDLERLGTGYWVGFSFTWMAELYVIQGNGNGAAYHLRTFWNHCCSQNGFHLNGDYKGFGTSTFHYRPFTLEANFCAADALQEMLLYSEEHSLVLFPAIPDAWKKGDLSFERFRAENGLCVSAHMQHGIVQSFLLYAPRAMQITLRNWDLLCHLRCHVPVTWEQIGNTAVLTLENEQEYYFAAP